jgi:hypothetical protein
MARFIYIFVIIFCSVHVRAQYREHKEDREDALQGVEKVLAVKTAERVAVNGGAVPLFMQNDTFRVWNKKILGANYTEEGSGLSSNGEGKMDAVRVNTTDYGYEREWDREL